jgi:hypothetical protein
MPALIRKLMHLGETLFIEGCKLADTSIPGPVTAIRT